MTICKNKRVLLTIDELVESYFKMHGDDKYRLLDITLLDQNGIESRKVKIDLIRKDESKLLKV